jgi:hypothetical protein
MKAICRLAVLLGLAASHVVAQQPGREASVSATNSSSLREESRIVAPLLEEPKSTQDVIVGKKLELSGPLVRPLKVKRLGDVPKALLQLINPLAVTERKVEFETTRQLSTRAWATTVGWHPGASAFPDPMTHESTMGLFVLGGKSRD